MAKMGVLHDYDLMANQEQAAQNQTCAICGASPMAFQWSDYSGEAMCVNCGCPYQLKWGTEEQIKNGNYPYLKLKDEFIPIAHKYWEEKEEFVCYGMMLGYPPGMANLMNWLEMNYPEYVKKKGE